MAIRAAPARVKVVPIDCRRVNTKPAIRAAIPMISITKANKYLYPISFLIIPTGKFFARQKNQKDNDIAENTGTYFFPTGKNEE